MSNEVNSQNPDVDEINLWGLLEVVKSGWRWVVAGVGIGLGGALALVLMVPSEYEATALVQPAYVATALVQPANAGLVTGGNKGGEVEPITQTLERLKIPTFYSDELVALCDVKASTNPLDSLAKAVKVSLVKGNSLIQITYRAASPKLAQACLVGIVDQIVKSQAVIATPAMDVLKQQLQLTKQQLVEAEGFEAKLEKKAFELDPSDVKFGQSMLILNTALLKRDEIAKLRRQYIDQTLQLTPPMTQPAKLLEPIYIPQNAVFPRKLLIVMGGLLSGGFVGLLGLFLSLSWRRYRTSHS
jgi:uncharacterized protein involved in exopolysaccharide biosynthesis